MITQWQHIQQEKARAGEMVRLIAKQLDHAIDEANLSAEDGNAHMQYMEHQQFLQAVQGGLNWWFNHEGGPWIYNLYMHYIRALCEAGFTGEIFDELYKEYSMKQEVR